MAFRTPVGEMNVLATFKLRGEFGVVQAYLKVDKRFEMEDNGDNIDNVERLTCTLHAKPTITTKHLMLIDGITYSIDRVIHNVVYSTLEASRTI